MGGDLEFQICWRMDFLVVALNLGQERKPLRQPIWPELWRKLARRRGLGRHTCPGCHCVTQGRAVLAQSELWRRMGSTGNGATPWAAGRKDGRAQAYTMGSCPSPAGRGDRGLTIWTQPVVQQQECEPSSQELGLSRELGPETRMGSLSLVATEV